MARLGYFIAKSILHKAITFIIIIIVIWGLLDLSISVTGSTPYDYLLSAAQTQPAVYFEYLDRIYKLGLMQEQVVMINGTYKIYIVSNYHDWYNLLIQLCREHHLSTSIVSSIAYDINRTIGYDRIPVVAHELIQWGKEKQETITIVLGAPRAINNVIVIESPKGKKIIETIKYKQGTVVIIDTNSSVTTTRKIKFMEPWYKRLVSTFISIATFDFGESALYHKPVIEVIMTYLPFTIGLVGLAFFIGSMTGFILGFYLSRKRGTAIDAVLTNIILAIRSMPVFWLGMIAVYFLAYMYGWFPSGIMIGFEHPTNLATYIFSWFWLTILPALVLSKIYVVQYMLSIRGLVMEEWYQDYVITFRGAGFDDDYIADKFIARTIAPPVITLMAIDLGFVFGGAVVTETVFNYPGIGRLTYLAIVNRDAPLIIGIFTIVTLAVLIAITIAEILYSVLDPRIRR